MSGFPAAASSRERASRPSAPRLPGSTRCGNGYVNAAELKDETTPSRRPLGRAPAIGKRASTGSHRRRRRGGGVSHRRPARRHLGRREQTKGTRRIEQMSAIAAPREDLGAIDSKLQQESFEEFPQFKIDKMEAMEDIVRYANGFVNYDLVKLRPDESGAMIDWLSDIIDATARSMRFEGLWAPRARGARQGVGDGRNPEADGRQGRDVRHDAARLRRGAGRRLLYDTMLVKCEQNADSRVTGVICRDGNDRHYLRVDASKGVIWPRAARGEHRDGGGAPGVETTPGISVPVGGSCTGDRGIRAARGAAPPSTRSARPSRSTARCCKPDEVAGRTCGGQVVLVR